MLISMLEYVSRRGMKKKPDDDKTFFSPLPSDKRYYCQLSPPKSQLNQEFDKSADFGMPVASVRTGMPKVPDTDVVIPISNLPAAELKGGIPTDKDWYTMRLERQVCQLVADKRDLTDKITYGLRVLQDELRLWKLGMAGEQWPTYSQVQNCMAKLQGAIDHLDNLDNTRHWMLDVMRERAERKRG